MTSENAKSASDMLHIALKLVLNKALKLADDKYIKY